MFTLYRHHSPCIAHPPNTSPARTALLPQQIHQGPPLHPLMASPARTVLIPQQIHKGPFRCLGAELGNRGLLGVASPGYNHLRIPCGPAELLTDLFEGSLIGPQRLALSGKGQESLRHPHACIGPSTGQLGTFHQTVKFKVCILASHDRQKVEIAAPHLFQ